MISDNVLIFSLTRQNKLKNVAIQLESQNTLMVFETEILCDKVKSVFECFDGMAKNVARVQLLESFVLANGRLGYNITEAFLDFESKLEKIVESRDDILKDYKEFLQMKDEYSKNQSRMLKLFKDRYTHLQQDYTKTLQEREQLRIKSADLEKKFSESTEELHKLRQKLKQRKSSGQGQDEEKFCSRCQKTYFEYENFNWSCKTHHGTIHENVYWCCGKAGKDSLGCVVAKHISKEDHDNCRSSDHYGSRFCVGCKKHGHSIFDCPKDPNLKSRADLTDESKRLEVLTAPKRRYSLLHGISQNEEGILMNIAAKMFGSEFAKNMDTEEEEEEMDGVFFRDLVEIKEEMNFEDKLLWLEKEQEGSFDAELAREKYRKKRTAVLIGKTFGEESPSKA